MKKSRMFEQIHIDQLDESVITDVFDGLVLDGLDFYLRDKKIRFPFEFSSLQEAKDYMSMSALMKREYLKNIFKEQTTILQFVEQNPEMNYENLSSINVSKVLRKCIHLAQ